MHTGGAMSSRVQSILNPLNHMGVYLNTFRTEHKTALFNGEPVKVFAYRFLCRANDIDDFWGERKRHSALLRSQCERATEKFDTLKPIYAVEIHEDSWDGARVYTALPGASHYDTEALSSQQVGFLRQLPGGHRKNGGWVITGERHAENNPIYCGLTFTRRYVERVALGVPYSLTVKSYQCQLNGAELTPAQFEAWKVTAEVEYLAKCQAAQVERDTKAAERAKLIQAKRDAKNVEIQAARERVTELERERSLIG